ncbi:SusC/RagA family TonB-linked outer membrane protein [Compostibacter hankyongensis]|uniref:TonB-dependent receptor n=1 Tax=Compostibacter hankyongensis TaxID=1007089 RepID=A0ABP8FFQ3_9BACT
MKNLPYRLCCLLSSCLLLSLSPAAAQQVTVTGVVTDSLGAAPLSGVTVHIKGSTTGTGTDAAGKYSLPAPANAVLVFSYVGYRTKEVPVNGKSVLNVSLSSSTSQLQQLVVVGYGTQKARDVSAAITSISTKDFNKGIVTNPVQQIQGKVAGLTITAPGGDPNASPIIRLRGQASLTGGQTPLVVVDGVPLDDPAQVANIPPGDIASYDVLKDASATAIYGSRGANGVIIINTKKGMAGNPVVTYSGYIGIDRVAKHWDMLDAAAWKDAARSIGTPESTIETYDHDADVDWQKAIEQTAFTNNHTLSVSGGTEHFTYHGSVNYINQEGAIINTGRNAVGLNFSANQKALDDRLNIQIGIISTQTNRKYADYNIFTYIASTPPVYPVYNKDGSYFAFQDFEQANAVEHQMRQLNTGKERLTIMTGTIDYDLIPSLKIGATGSLSYFNNQTGFFQPSYPIENNFNNGNQYTEDRNSKKGNLHINYNQTWGKSNFAATLVHEYNDFIYDNFKASGQQFLAEINQNNSLENGNPAYNEINSYKEEYELASFLGRVTYNYNEKYYIEASFRRDGSSKFGSHNRWGNFPSVSAAWRISGESFMENVSWVSDLKIKAGYGVTGNQDAIDAYRSQQLLGSVGRYYDQANQRYPLAYAPSQNPNEDLKWEEKHGMNVGLDFSLFNNRLGGDINVFHDKTKNLLYDYTVPVPPYYVNTILANVGDLTNKGIEIALNGDIVKGQHFTWSANGQITFIKTTVDNLSGTYAGNELTTDDIPGGTAAGRGLSDNPITYLKVGYSPYVFFLPHFVGVDDDGNQLFDDGKGGQVTQGDLDQSMYRYTDPAAKFNYGFGSTLTYDQWGLNFFLRGVSGQKIFDDTRMLISNINRLPGNNVIGEALTNGIKDAQVASDLWLEKASYLRMDNITLSYTFSHISALQSLQLYVSANNLFVITPYKGLDPEIRITGDDLNHTDVTNQAYIDANYGSDGYYPKTRSFSFGVNVSFK